MSDWLLIDDKYTYVYDEGRVEIMRHGRNWLTDPTGPKAWIAAAGEIERLREENGSLRLESLIVKEQRDSEAALAREFEVEVDNLKTTLTEDLAYQEKLEAKIERAEKRSRLAAYLAAQMASRAITHADGPTTFGQIADAALAEVALVTEAGELDLAILAFEYDPDQED